MLAIGGISAQSGRVTPSTSLSAPVVYYKAGTDTLVANSIARALKPIIDANLKRDASIKSLQDGLKIARDSIKILAASYASLRDVYWGDGFTISSSKMTDTVKNTSTLLFKSFGDSIIRLLSGSFYYILFLLQK